MDRGPNLDAHPDLVVSNRSNPVLQRNKSERVRLQGLMRMPTISSASKNGNEPRTWKDKWDLWMINEGGRRLFFFTYIFLHLLVFIFGVFHYQLKDNLNTARSLFAGGFGAFRFFILVVVNLLRGVLITDGEVIPLLYPLVSAMQLPLVQPRWSFTSTSYSSSSQSAATSSLSSVVLHSTTSSPSTRTSPSTKQQHGPSSSSPLYTQQHTWSISRNWHRWIPQRRLRVKLYSTLSQPTSSLAPA